jgi:arylsulfatase A-like enzyme
MVAHALSRRFLRLFVPLLVALSAAPAGLGGLRAQPRLPNIVFIVADDLGYADVGFNGGRQIRTPTLDALAAGGARLEQHYVQQVCSPTRAALLTGRYPMRHGLQVGVVRPWAQYGLPLDERTLQHALKEAGYATALVGKWHLGHFDPAYLPTARGFDRQYGHYNGQIDYHTHVRDGGFDWHRDDRASYDEGYSTHLIAQETVRLIGEFGGKRPFFLDVSFNAVHAPLQVPESYKKPYADLPEPRRTYAGMLAAMDEAVGQIVAAIDRAGIRENTLIVFTSDNGGPQPGKVTDNGALRAGKATLYEGGVRAAAFSNWPGRIPPGTVVREPLHIVDWYPTLLKLAGATLTQKLPLDGRDAWPTIAAGKPSPHDAILINASPRTGALRAGDWKLVLNGSGAANEVGDVENDRAGAAAGTVELFNLAEDPSERTNLAGKHPDRVKTLRARYDALAAQAVPPKIKPRPADFQVPKIWGER